jgi:hypothetical protein
LTKPTPPLLSGAGILPSSVTPVEYTAGVAVPGDAARVRLGFLAASGWRHAQPLALCSSGCHPSVTPVEYTAGMAVSGLLGLAFLLRTMHRLVLIQEALDGPRPASPPPAPQAGEGGQAPVYVNPSGAMDRVGMFTSRKALRVFRIWTVVFALVGIQMGWVLRPFIGSPHSPTQFFRKGAWGNAYVKLAEIVVGLIGG